MALIRLQMLKVWMVFHPVEQCFRRGERMIGRRRCRSSHGSENGDVPMVGVSPVISALAAANDRISDRGVLPS
jgi:hypothetical protein